jgi:hypothetical protein
LIYNNPNYRDDGIDTRRFSNQCVFINENEAYYVSTNQVKTWDGTAENKHIALMYYNFTTNTIQTIFDKELGSAVYMYKEIIYLYVNEGKLYINYCIVTDTTNFIGDYYVQRFDGIWNPIQIATNKLCAIIFRSLYVSNDYNLLKIFCYPSNLTNRYWYFPVVKEVYNPNQYNGEPYVDTSVLSPLYANLYSDGSLVFSRNLYNISKQNNMTMSSVEIPNNYLNDLTITQNDLISETNLQMNSNLQNWTKNIYEVVDLNFLNTISVIDEDTNTPYLQSAIRINNAITDINDYSNASCTKVRINYLDNSTKVFPISWIEIDEFNKETEFSIYVDKPILSIDFISNDTNTIYCTKELEVEVGKYYTINEKIKVGD